MLRPALNLTKICRNPALKETVRFDCTKHSIVSTPPRVRISFIEKMCLGVFFCVGILAPPVYFSAHFKEYRGESEE